MSSTLTESNNAVNNAVNINNAAATTATSSSQALTGQGVYVPLTAKVQTFVSAWQSTQQILERARNKGAAAGERRVGPTVLAIALNDIPRSKTAAPAMPTMQPMMMQQPQMVDANGYPILQQQPQPMMAAQPMMAPQPQMVDANGYPIPLQPQQMMMPQPQMMMMQPPPQAYGYVQPQQQQRGGGNNNNNNAPKKRSVRVQFMVVRVLDAGWGFGSDDPLSKKSARAPLAVSVGNGRHVCMHSYELIEPDGANGRKLKGSRSHEYVMVSPGMIFSVGVWEDAKIAEAFAEQDRDIKMFDVLSIELLAKSLTTNRSSAYSKDSRIGIKSVRLVNSLAASSPTWLPSRIFANSLPDATALLAHFVAGTHLSPSALALRAPHGDPSVTDDDAGVSALPTGTIHKDAVLQQSWISKNLASSVFAMRVTPTEGTFAIGPDDVLRFHGTDSILEAAGLTTPTFPVHYDAKLYSSNATWAAHLLNVALFVGAAELLIIADTYTGAGASEGDGNGTGTTVAYARVRQGPWSDVFFSKVPLPALPSFVLSSVLGGPASRHLVVFEVSPKVHIVLDTRAGANANKAAAPVVFGGMMQPNDVSWERGHVVYVFVSEEPIFHFLAPIAVPGLAAGASATTRGFETLTALPTSLIFDDDDDDDAATVVAGSAEAIAINNNNNSKAPPPKRAKRAAVAE